MRLGAIIRISRLRWFDCGVKSCGSVRSALGCKHRDRQTRSVRRSTLTC